MSESPAPDPDATGGERDGQVVTFYSYKGGVGRSMAVANVATLLAQAGQRVLVVDFDLEAPGLHRYFSRPAKPPAAADGGTIDLFTDAVADLGKAPPVPGGIDAAVRAWVGQALDGPRYVREMLVAHPDGEQSSPVFLLPAGRFDEGYPQRVRQFSWQDLFHACPQVFSIVAEELSRRYDYTLIDSRTGITDVGSICTVLLPEKLVLVFSPNDQSLNGALEVGRQSVEQRKAADDLRPLPIYPLISRVENAEEDLQRTWIDKARVSFEEVFAQVYGLPRVDLRDYFKSVQIPHRSKYSYGELIAAELQSAAEVHSLAFSFRKFVEFLRLENPISAQAVLKLQPLESGPSEAARRIADAEVRTRVLEDELARARAAPAPRRSTAIIAGVILVVLAVIGVVGVRSLLARKPAPNTAEVDSLRATIEQLQRQQATQRAVAHDLMAHDQALDLHVMPDVALGGSPAGRSALEAAVGQLNAGVRATDTSKAGENRSAAIDEYNRTAGVPAGSKWAVSFVYWCFQQHTPGLLPKTARVSELLVDLKRRGWLRPAATYQARPGDIAFVRNDDDTMYVALVHHADGRTVYAIAGTYLDAADPVRRVAGAVFHGTSDIAALAAIPDTASAPRPAMTKKE